MKQPVDVAQALLPERPVVAKHPILVRDGGLRGVGAKVGMSVVGPDRCCEHEDGDGEHQQDADHRAEPLEDERGHVSGLRSCR